MKQIILNKKQQDYLGEIITLTGLSFTVDFKFPFNLGNIMFNLDKHIYPENEAILVGWQIIDILINDNLEDLFMVLLEVKQKHNKYCKLKAFL